MMERRQALDGSLPQPGRARPSGRSRCPTPEVFDEFDARLGQAGGVDHHGVHPPAAQPVPRRRASAPRVVPIIPDEARTFGMDALFKEFGIYAVAGPALRAGRPQRCCCPTARPRTARSSRRASPRPARWRRGSPPAPRYATRGVPMVPFFTFYSMFGFQRVGDLIWAAADARARGFLLGATAGRTTLLGEGLQHQDGHSLVLASTVPVVPGLRPRLRLRDGGDHPATASSGCTAPSPEDVFYYLTLYNENYVMPAEPEGVDRRRHRRGPLPVGAGARRARAHRATILFSRHGPGRGPRRRRTSWPSSYGVGAELWCATSLQAPARGGARGRALEPAAPEPSRRARRSVTELLGRRAGPDRRRHRLHEGGARPGRPVGARPVHCRSAPTASAAATPARRCAGSSRSTPATSSSPCWPSLAAAATSSPRSSPTPSPATTSTPRHPTRSRPDRDRQPNDTESISHVPRSSVVARSWVTPPGTRPRSATIVSPSSSVRMTGSSTPSCAA